MGAAFLLEHISSMACLQTETNYSWPSVSVKLKLCTFQNMNCTAITQQESLKWICYVLPSCSMLILGVIVLAHFDILRVVVTH